MLFKFAMIILTTQTVFSTITPKAAKSVLKNIHQLYKEEIFRHTRLPSRFVVSKSNGKDYGYARFSDSFRGYEVVIEPRLFRVDLADQDLLSLIVCHELGHLVGGAPKMIDPDTGRPGLFSAEGQADYFATAKCLKTLWKDTVRFNSVDPYYVDPMCSNQENPALCRRIANSIGNFIRLLGRTSANEEIFFSQRGRRSRAYTLLTHPSPTCRMETLLAGTFCTKPASDLFLLNDPLYSSCNKIDGYPSVMTRPACWFMEHNYLNESF